MGGHAAGIIDLCASMQVTDSATGFQAPDATGTRLFFGGVPG